ncbi:hypothetical protein Q9Q99_05880 [Curtobacterium flaccumfaciens]|nr:hypothetical protein Q9Q99_05880 [Curtobacterium flaccumfaciens]
MASLAVAVSGLTFGTVLSEQTTTRSASAAVASDFDPGNIISDANFYNGSAMSAAAVQSFLTSVAPNCRKASGGPACLKDFSQKMSSIGAVSGRCKAIAGGTKSAATMIAQVGAACGISQKVLLVLLQKEQGIVTTSSPTSYMYLHATGFACPDTAPCDPAYFGFGQQVYAAALQFKRYQATPTSWAYQAGRTNSILLNPNAACGRKSVYIQNQATAALYIYTPYTPNAAAMSNLYGSGDGCSALRQPQLLAHVHRLVRRLQRQRQPGRQRRRGDRHRHLDPDGPGMGRRPPTRRTPCASRSTSTVTARRPSPPTRTAATWRAPSGRTTPGTGSRRP